MATYNNLPVEALYKLLAVGIKNLLASHDAKDESAFNAYKKYIVILITVIEQKKTQPA